MRNKVKLVVCIFGFISQMVFTIFIAYKVGEIKGANNVLQNEHVQSFEAGMRVATEIKRLELNFMIKHDDESLEKLQRLEQEFYACTTIEEIAEKSNELAELFPSTTMAKASEN